MKIEDLFLIRMAYEVNHIEKMRTKLGKSEDKIIKQLLHIQSTVGTHLFDISKNNIIFTEDGLEFYHCCVKAARGLDNLQRAFQRHQKIDVLEVAVEDSISLEYIILCSQIVAEKYDVKFNFIYMTGEEVIRRVHEGVYEVGVITKNRYLSDQLEKNGLAFHPRSSRRSVVIVDSKHPLSKKKEISLKNLKGYQRIALDKPLEDVYVNCYQLKEKYGIPNGKILVKNVGEGFQLLKESGMYMITGINEGAGQKLEGLVDIPIKELKGSLEVGYIHRKDEIVRDLFEEIAQLVYEFKAFNY